MAMKPLSNALVDHSLELLSALGQASAQRMFGGHGLRVDGLFIALVAFDRLYLKVDGQTRTLFAEAGCEPFVYTAKGRQVSLNYWTVPPQAMDSPEQMRPWARLALEAALRARAMQTEPHRQQTRARRGPGRPAGTRVRKFRALPYRRARLPQ